MPPFHGYHCESVACCNMSAPSSERSVSGAGAEAEGTRRPTRRLYEHSLHALLSSCVLLSSPLLLLGLLLSGVSRAARTPRPVLHGCNARNSKVSKALRTGIGPTRRWLILGWLSLVSGFRLPEDNGAAAEIGADRGLTSAEADFRHQSTSAHRSTITGEARDRRQLASGSSCDGWYVSPPRLFVPPCVTLPMLPCPQRHSSV